MNLEALIGRTAQYYNGRAVVVGYFLDRGEVTIALENCEGRIHTATLEGLCLVPNDNNESV